MKLPAPASTAPATLGAGIAAVGAACIVAAVTSPIFVPFDATKIGFLVAFTTTFGFAFALAKWTLLASSRSWLVKRTIAGGVLLGLAASFSVFAMLLLSGELSPGMSGTVASICIALVGAMITGAPFGALLSLGFLPLLNRAHAAVTKPSHAGRAQVLRAGGVWLAILAEALGALTFLFYDGRSFGGQHASDAGAAAAATVALLVGVASVTVGITTISMRRRWLAKVRAGQVEGYRIVPLEQTVPSRLRIAPFESAEDDVYDEALVRVVIPLETDYRSAAAPADEEPVALLRAQYPLRAKA